MKIFLYEHKVMGKNLRIIQANIMYCVYCVYKQADFLKN